jgi:hypothetical protein
MQQRRLVGACLKLAAGQNSGSGSLYGLIGGQNNGLGLSISSFVGLSVEGQNGQEFGFDLGGGSNRQLGPHIFHYFINVGVRYQKLTNGREPTRLHASERISLVIEIEVIR